MSPGIRSISSVSNKKMSNMIQPVLSEKSESKKHLNEISPLNKDFNEFE